MTFPASPKPGNVPSVTYRYEPNPDDGAQPQHQARCKCRWEISVTDPVTCRRAVQTHVGSHLARMIFDPEPDLDD